MTVKELIELLQVLDPNLPVARYAMEGEGSEDRQPTAPWDQDIMDVVLIS